MFVEPEALYSSAGNMAAGAGTLESITSAQTALGAATTPPGLDSVSAFLSASMAAYHAELEGIAQPAVIDKFAYGATHATSGSAYEASDAANEAILLASAGLA